VRPRSHAAKPPTTATLLAVAVSSPAIFNGFVSPVTSPIPFDSSWRILCVEDDPIVQRTLMLMLVRRGWSVECVCEGQEALERFVGDARGFDVFVTDHKMPRMDGLELTRALRACGFGGAVIVISGHLEPNVRAEYRALGVAAILMKPLGKAELLAAVENATTLPPVARHSSPPLSPQP
jgi:CheY-like chemotaxis protein